MDTLRSDLLRFSETADHSRTLDHLREFHSVIAASGMCEAGRIRHRLKNRLWREEATVLFVGYQAEGTLGRLLQGGTVRVRIQDDEIAVRARVRSIDLYSGHADGPELLSWIRERMPVALGIFIVHGEEDAMSGLTARIGNLLPAERIVKPVLDQKFELTPEGAVPVADATPARLPPERVARLDWHKDVSRLMLHINDALHAIPDKNHRAVLIRRLRHAWKTAHQQAAIPRSIEAGMPMHRPGRVKSTNLPATIAVAWLGITGATIFS